MIPGRSLAEPARIDSGGEKNIRRFFRKNKARQLCGIIYVKFKNLLAVSSCSIPGVGRNVAGVVDAPRAPGWFDATVLAGRWRRRLNTQMNSKSVQCSSRASSGA